MLLINRLEQYGLRQRYSRLLTQHSCPCLLTTLFRACWSNRLEHDGCNRPTALFTVVDPIVPFTYVKFMHVTFLHVQGMLVQWQSCSCNANSTVQGLLVQNPVHSCKILMGVDLTLDLQITLIWSRIVSWLKTILINNFVDVTREKTVMARIEAWTFCHWFNIDSDRKVPSIEKTVFNGHNLKLLIGLTE